MQKITAYILTYNEAAKIEAAVSSVLWADDILVVDSQSTDRTVELAQALGARVVQIPFEGFGALRNRAIEACRHDWIFSLDADERCTPAARDEILKLLDSSSSCFASSGERELGLRHAPGTNPSTSLRPAWSLPRSPPPETGHDVCSSGQAIRSELWYFGTKEASMVGGGVHAVEIIFLLLLLFVVVFGAVARRLNIPYPIVLVIGGLLLAHIALLQIHPAGAIVKKWPRMARAIANALNTTTMFKDRHINSQIIAELSESSPS
jgi:glycosyltransferase involved in cell wall biosynthesis